MIIDGTAVTQYEGRLNVKFFCSELIIDVYLFDVQPEII